MGTELIYNRGTGLPIVNAIVRFNPHNGIGHPTGTVPQIAVKALIDTGATNLVLSKRIVNALGLTFVANINNAVVGGKINTVRAYAADVIIGGDNGNPTYTVTGSLAVQEEMNGPDFDIIIGFDILKHMTWKFEPSGRFSASW